MKSFGQLNNILIDLFKPDLLPADRDKVLKELRNETYVQTNGSVADVLPYAIGFICTFQTTDPTNLKRTILMNLVEGADLTEITQAQTLIELICSKADFLEKDDLLSILRKFTNNWEDINKTDSSGKTLLHYAAVGGNTKVAEILLENGADINATDREGGTPLSLSCKHNKFETFKFLVEKEADIHKQYTYKGSSQQNLLHIIADSLVFAMGGYINQRDEFAKLLVKKGIDINAQDSNGKTPLHIASQKNYISLARIICDSLLTQGSDPHFFADPFIKDGNEGKGKTAENYACTPEMRAILASAEEIKLSTILAAPRTLSSKFKSSEVPFKKLPSELVRLFREKINLKSPTPNPTATLLQPGNNQGQNHL